MTILKHLKIFVKKEEQNKYSSSELFKKLKSNLADEVLPVRLQFVLSITEDLELFLNFFSVELTTFLFLV